MLKNDHRRDVFQMLSYYLNYPGDPAFWAGLSDAKAWAEEVDQPSLAALADGFVKTGQAALERVYVETFDFQESSTLYVTAHELGDSRNRGAALIQFRKLVADAGYEEASEELPDYMPLLFELLAVKSEDLDTAWVEERLAKVCQAILNKLTPDHPYHDVFVVACSVLPDLGGVEVVSVKEQPDLDALPYPIQYL